ncbi:MAG: aminotransferase class III-fold pyridoxal phosphate-dependent enzyme [Candidatus Niyogibacteria bacterium]|nr:aminotransferase class III-fold pyridoxal phosphate-dependent enzyme [Candidatus Niyogibacteria bacterium]
MGETGLETLRTLELIARHKKVLATTTHNPNLPVFVEKGKGIYVWDNNGKKYIDCFSQVGIADIGHCHPEVVEAIKIQAERLMACIGTDVYNTVQIEAAEKLSEITKKSFPQRDWRVYFCSSGGEANNAAIKLLLDQRPQRKKFISFLGAFHGRFGYALDIASSKSLHKTGFPKALDVIHLPYPDCLHCAYEKSAADCGQLCVRFIEKEILGRLCDPKEISGVIMEPIQGEGGFVVPNSAAIRKLYNLCQKYGWVLVSDEVQAGLGRTGKMFAIEHFEVTPDIICLAKKLGSGVPIGAIVFPRDWDFTKSGRHSTTFGGGPLGWAAAIATLKVLEKENLVENAAKMGSYFLAEMKKIQKFYYKIIGDVRGLGLMIGVEFINEEGRPNSAFRDAVLKKGLDNGLLLLGAGHSERNPVIRFLPPLTVTKDEVDLIIHKFHRSLREIYKAAN